MIRWISLLAAACLTMPALALEVVPYDATAFAQAQAAGKVTALQFHSGWCPICVMQERGVVSLKDDKVLDQVVVFRADFMKEDALRKRFHVDSFSTLVLFRGTEEKARTTGDFRPEQLKPFFAKAF